MINSLLSKDSEMKRVFILFIIFTLISIPIKDFNSSLNFINRYRYMRILKFDYYKKIHREILLKSIIQVESKGNFNAYNENTDAVGILQITPIMLKHANKIVGYDRYKLDDRWNVEKSIEIFWIVQEYHNPNLWLDQACHLWNAGISDKKFWDITSDYREMVSIEYNKLMAQNFR